MGVSSFPFLIETKQPIGVLEPMFCRKGVSAWFQNTLAVISMYRKPCHDHDGDHVVVLPANVTSSAWYAISGWHAAFGFGPLICPATAMRVHASACMRVASGTVG